MDKSTKYISFIFALFLSLGSLNLSAANLTYTTTAFFNLVLSPTASTSQVLFNSFTFPTFNTNLGTLTGVLINSTGLPVVNSLITLSQINAQNPFSAQTSLTSSLTVGSATQSVLNGPVINSLNANQGPQDSVNANFPVSSIYSLLNATTFAQLAPFRSTSGSSVIVQLAYTLTSIATNAIITSTSVYQIDNSPMQITYVYTALATPEPMTYLLMGSMLALSICFMPKLRAKLN